MRTLITTMLIAALLVGCKATEKLSKEETIAQNTEKVNNQNYTFMANRAMPMGGKSIDISYGYSLKVSKDSVISFLPYFGRAYTAPTSDADNGIKFTSTDFTYTTKGEKGTWDINIEPNDNQRKYKLSLNISDNGSATLHVQDSRRQSITFYGHIE